MSCQALFTSLAADYDRLNHAFSLGRDLVWRRKAAALVRGRPRRILDVACGTGDFAFALAARFPSAQVVGLDLTPAMLEVARAKDAAGRIDFRSGDAQAMGAGFPPASFDLATCAFGFRNMPDVARALAQTASRLGTGGELVVLEFFRPTGFLLRRFTELWVGGLVRVLARRRTGAFDYLLETMRRTLSEDEFGALARAEGLELAERRFFFPCCTCLRFVRPRTPEAEGRR